ncbi:hypothetical protein [Paenibacillus segetis]|uniref:Transposase n=1 Tax=Paenibacillus segetis TaxID=1325360 RepID=A0ABQ1YV81_9BACL|nr:hypothetical protein [Paenibacillus segetis]GGH37844.1 hypothetical protein GCM10008013_45520 [Paenibacillus segetis]
MHKPKAHPRRGQRAGAPLYLTRYLKRDSKGRQALGALPYGKGGFGWDETP